MTATMQKIRPTADGVLIQRDKPEDTSPGGIVLPDNAKRKTTSGVVIAVGPGKQLENGERESMNLDEGDRVLFGTYSGIQIDPDNEDLIFVRFSEVLAVTD